MRRAEATEVLRVLSMLEGFILGARVTIPETLSGDLALLTQKMTETLIAEKIPPTT